MSQENKNNLPERKNDNNSSPTPKVERSGFLWSFNTEEKQKELEAFRSFQEQLVHFPSSPIQEQDFPLVKAPEHQEKAEKEIHEVQSQEEVAFGNTVEGKKAEFQKIHSEIESKKKDLRTPPNFALPSFSIEAERIKERISTFEIEFQNTKEAILGKEKLLKEIFTDFERK